MKNDRQALLERVHLAPSGCWIWKLKADPSGYPSGKVEGRTRLIHRVAFELFVGPIPAGLELDHLCHRILCVNPMHLDPVTQRVNALRSSSLAAMAARRERCLRGHPLDGRRKNHGRTIRYCRVCANAQQRRWLERRSVTAA